MVGKWHLEPNRQRLYPDGPDVPDAHYAPGKRGFEDYWNGPMMKYEANFDLAGNTLPDAPRTVQDGRFRVLVQTDAALAFLKRRETDPRPFFLYLAYFAPHAPMQASPPHMERMAHVKERERRMGLSAILAVDDGIGQIRQRLSDMGRADNTLIFYISDNGAPLREGAYVGSSNSPLVGEKGMETDGGQRVPFIAAWPGTIPGGQIFEWPVWTLDASATLLSAAGVALDERIEGHNLLPYLIERKAGPVHEVLPWRWRSQTAILTGDGKWKFVRLGKRDRYLFDMSEIGHETAAHNRIRDYPEVARDLEKRLASIADTWQTKGLPEAINQQDEDFFELHVKNARQPAGAGPVPNSELSRSQRSASTLAADPLQGWALRNAQLILLPADQGGGISYRAERRQAVPFLAQRFAKPLKAPVKVEIEARSSAATRGHLAWIAGPVAEGNFVQSPAAEFVLPAGDDWQIVRATIEAESAIAMIRLFPAQSAAEAAPILRRIRLIPAQGQPLEFVLGSGQ
jgi:arylsulfatase A-like enzyme